MHINQKRICEGKSSHGFHYNNGSWYNDWIMAAFNFYGNGVATFVYGGLLCKNGWCWFDGGTEYDITSIADTAKYAAGMIGGLTDCAVYRNKSVVIFRTFAFCNGKACP